jgi:ABC-2 type transport system ATP-binding protein
MPFKLIRKERFKTNEGRKMGSCILETRGLVKRFGRGSREQTAVDGVSLHVEEGKVYGLLGPNGAGKSTTLKMITGMLRPSEGQILFEQRPWQRSDLYRIGSLVEQPPLYPNLTARENMRVRTTMLGLPDERIDEVLSTVGLADTGTKRTDRFSMGMKQRLGIALALLTQPKLLILDEPTNGLDPIGIEELRIIIREFPKHGITVLLSSHILNEVQQTADSVGIIVNGRLAYEGALQKEQDLEALFMEVCRNGGAR